MNTYISKRVMSYLIFSALTGLSSISYAENADGVKFFSSNNTSVITLEKAYDRLAGKPQHELKNSTINFLQVNHIEQGRFENILGTYQMMNDKQTTGDNTEVFYASPLQKFSNEQVFALATQLANKLEQESVAVFIPSAQYSVADVCINFKNNQPNINEAITMIHEKLPAPYSSAFSLRVKNSNANFKNAKVTKIEWLGNNKNIADIKKAFPQADVSYKYGQSFLVYKNGSVESI